MTAVLGDEATLALLPNTHSAMGWSPLRSPAAIGYRTTAGARP
jgi:hypothetical protein